MATSSIKPKRGYCIDCPEDAPEMFLTAGRCKNHYWKYRANLKAGETAIKGATKIKRKPAESKINYGPWFQERIENIPYRCENCNEPFGFIPPWQRSFVCAHVLPKATFESVAIEPENCMYLCVTNGCHHAYDNKGQKHRQSMNCYQLALKKVESFYHKLTDHEQIKLTKYL